MKSLAQLSRGKKVNTGGAWEGSLWRPDGEMTKKAREAAEEHGNDVHEHKFLRGRVAEVRVFDSEKRFSLEEAIGSIDGENWTEIEDNVLLPDWGGMMRDAQSLELDGTVVELQYTGKVEIKKGRFKGEFANTVDIFALD